MYGLEEGSQLEEEKNSEEDVEKVKEVFSAVNPEVCLANLDKSRIQRVGTKKVAEEGKLAPRPRPVKIVMDSFEMKMGILRKARKLKDSKKINRIGLSYDKTKKEQEDYRKLKVKLDEKNKETGGTDYQIFRGKIVLKTEVQNIIRKGKENNGTNWASETPVGGNPGGAPKGIIAGGGGPGC